MVKLRKKDIDVMIYLSHFNLITNDISGKSFCPLLVVEIHKESSVDLLIAFCYFVLPGQLRIRVFCSGFLGDESKRGTNKLREQ